MIAHVFNSSIVSGPETLVLPALRNLSTPVSVFFLMETRLEEKSQGPIEYARKLGHEVHVIPVRSRWDSRAFVELRNRLEEVRPVITHAHDVKASLYLHQARKLRPGFPGAVVSTHHGAAYRKGKIRLYEEFYVRWILPQFDLVLSVCERDRQSIARRGVARDRVAVHLNGTDRPYVPAEKRASISKRIREKWKEVAPGLPDPADAFFLGVVARLSEEKRHDRMLHVISYMKRMNLPKPVILLCFGTGAEEARLRSLAQDLNVEDSIYWMGYSETISEEMAGFDLLLCLSDGEGIPMSLLEAGWAGTPVLATAVGGIPDLISTPKVGHLVRKEDSDYEIALRLKEILLDPASTSRIGASYQTHVSTRFSQKAWLERLRELYANLHKPTMVSTV